MPEHVHPSFPSFMLSASNSIGRLGTEDGGMARLVHCRKLDKDLPGLWFKPFKNDLGQRIYDEISQDAWKMWLEHSKMIMNEFRLNPLDPQSLKIMEEQMEQFFFGEGAKLPENYVPQRSKS